MRGKRTDSKLIDVIAILRATHSPSEIIEKMASRMSKRTVYRILAKLRARDEELRAEEEERKREEAERRREKAERDLIEYIEFLQSRKRYKKSSDLPPNLRRVRSS